MSFKLIKKLILLIYAVIKIICVVLFILICIILIPVFLFVLFLLGTWLTSFIHPSLEQQLFSSIDKKCYQEKACKIHLHEITSFKWDKAYFFNYKGRYSKQDIKKITGVTGDFKQDMETLVIFTYQGNLVKYDLFRTAYDYFLPQSGTIKSFNINFDTNKDELHQLHYSGNLGDFSENISIHYYHVDLENDILYADCDLETQNRNSIKACWLSFTNLDQIHLYNPKK